MRLAPFALILLATTAAAQVDTNGPRFPGFDPGGAVRAFRAGGGPEWQVHWDYDRGGVPRLLWGGSRAGVAPGSGDAAYAAAARQLVDELAPALGFDASAVELLGVERLPLSRAGGTDKIAVHFRQVVSGVPVFHGAVDVLYGADGRLLSLDNQGLPHAAQTPLSPDVPERDASAAAAAAFTALTGRPVASLELADYVLFPAKIDARKTAVRAAPAYLFKVAAPRDIGSGETPVVRMLAIAARGAPVLFESWSLVHEDLSGTVKGWGQTGALPDGSAGAVLHNLEDVLLTASGVNPAYTNAAGGFVMPGVNSSKSVTAQLEGQWSKVVNAAGGSASVTLTLAPGAPQTFTFNTGVSEQQTAEVNAHTFVETMRDWLRSIDPGEGALDFQVLSYVNEADICNAFYDGFSLNFFLAGGGCPNTAYRSVVFHEEGHWANDLFGSYNGSDGFGEGAADCWAMYIGDDPVIGPDFHGPGADLRTGLNTVPFCGDESPACYGEVHDDGQPLMGAIWKVRARLKTALGAGPGGDLADALFVGWFQAFNDMQIKTIIEEHWLILDDNDGNIYNGTPHFAQIDGGFQDQGFPGYVPPYFTIAHTPVTLVNSEGPVLVQANVTEITATVASVKVFYKLDGAPSYSSVNLTHGAGTSWSGLIPGANSPAIVDYYLLASDASSHATSLPAKAPTEFFAYDVGTITVHAGFDFEAGDDQGWTHVEYATQDDWMRGAPTGVSPFDPPSAWSGSQVWGNDLGVDGFDGNYKPDVHNALISPVLNMSGKTGLRLRFKRWLSVEKGIYDQASLYLNNAQLYTNPSSTDVIDQSWKAQDYDVSSLADNNPSVQLTFELISDPGLEFGGWNIDDVQLVTLGPVTGGPFSEYGTGTKGTGGVAPHLVGSGQATPGGTITLTLSGAKPNAPGMAFFGTTQAAIPAFGGTFLVGNVFVTALIPTNGAGGFTLNGNLPSIASIVGLTVRQQYWCADPLGPAGKAGSNGLQFTIQ